MNPIITRILGGVLSLLFVSMLPIFLLCATGWQKFGVVPVAYFGWVFARYAIKWRK